VSYQVLIALRYLRAKRRQRTVSLNTFISIAGVTLGVAALIATLAVMSGFEENLREKILGTNAHVVLQEAPPSVPAAAARPLHALPLSARTPDSLRRLAERYRLHLSAHPDLLAHGTNFRFSVAVMLGAYPPPGVHHAGAQLCVNVVHRRQADGVKRPSGQDPQFDRCVRRA